MFWRQRYWDLYRQNPMELPEPPMYYSEYKTVTTNNTSFNTTHLTEEDVRRIIREEMASMPFKIDVDDTVPEDFDV
jgi:hypothetical protein